ncbi:MAG TPA: cysteine desulfurase family protein [Acidimicrobiales bacterium]|nr:cysteine desulfurase family protein [Acidimicrobiales bacterium]
MSLDVPATRSYLDHASTSPLRPEARQALVEQLAATGDPGRIHAEALAARAVVEEAREQVAELVGARPREVVFTSGATEAIAAACWGAAARGAHQVVPAVEHSAVRRAAERHGEVALAPVDGRGRVAVDDVLAAVRPDTALVHVQWGNHEVGTVQPVAEVMAACRERGVLTHVDAAQAVGHVEVDFRALGADLLSLSAHKLGGPGGVGALLVRQGLRLAPLMVGGDQERARRAGLENVAAIAGFGAACAALSAGSTPSLAAEAAEQRRLTRRILDAVTGDALGLVVYGDPAERLPHIICLGVEGVEPQAVLLGLDRAGIAAHSGSACSSEALEPSPVLEAMGVDAHHSLRLSVGWSTTDADIDRLLAALPTVLADLRTLATRA